jgi:hypothetical protein
LFLFITGQPKTSIEIDSESLERRIALERRNECEILFGFYFDSLPAFDDKTLE